MELSEVMRTSWTCRYFRPDPVPDDVLRAAFDDARFAPQGGNRQPVRWVVVRDPALRQGLADLYAPLWADYTAPARAAAPAGTTPRSLVDADHFAAHLAEVPLIVVLCARLSSLYPTDDRLGRLSVVGGASLYPAMQNLCLALRDRGVASAVTTLLCRSEPAVRELLGIPDDHVTAAHLAVGHPQRPFPTRLSRRPVAETVALDRFGTALFPADR